MATLTTTPIKTFVSGETVTPTKLNELSRSTVALTAGTIVAADIASDAVTTVKILDANVTTAKLAAVTAQSLLPAGAVMPFAMNSAPAGWLNCTGQAVSRTAYNALFSVIGTAYGSGDGSTTFNVPDLRGYFVRGWGTNSDGTTSGNFASKQADAFESHNHGGITGNDSPDHTHLYNPPYSSSIGVANGSFGQVPLALSAQTSTSGRANFHTHSISGEGGSETRPANIAMLYCIKT